MTNFNEYETKAHRFNRQRNESIVNEYKSRAHDILSGKVTPHRMCEFLGERYNMSRYGITLILKRAGVYKSASQPVSFNTTPTISFIGDTTSPEVNL